MRAMAATALIVSLSATAAVAQTPKAQAPKVQTSKASTAPSTAPKPVQTTTIRPDGSTAPARPAAAAPAPSPADSAAFIERLSLQSDLAWVGSFNGVINGEASDRLITAIKAFQKDNGGKPTGTLTPQERSALATAAKALQDSAGWKIGLDPLNGIKLGLPTKLVPVQSTGATGTKWASAQGQIQIETWRAKDTNLTIAAMADREKKEPAGRKVEYSVIKPDFFVLSGSQGLKKFYVRGQSKGTEVRGVTILYDQATEGTMGPVVIAMSSAFAPFAGGDTSQAPAPPPRKKVEYATGVIVSPDGAIVTARDAVEGCEVIVTPPYGHAERVREDRASGLALLQVYGASGLKPVGFAATPSKSDVTVTGIADPQSQAGGSIVSSAASHLASSGGDVKLDPAPGLGLSGAAVTDTDGHFAGLALLKPALVAGPAIAPAPASLVPAEIVRAFLTSANVSPAPGPFDARASVVRVICVRK